VIIKNQILLDGKLINITYHDADSFADLPLTKCHQVYGFCFYKGKLIIGYEINKQRWQLIGGGIEPGETFEQTLFREVKEESNMNIVKFWPVGFQWVMPEDTYQPRYCCLVEPYGAFVSDPDGDITKIKFIKPEYFPKYVDWQKIGDRLVERSVELVNKSS
jgi:8-oxo-dGTP pyrophosphatase MutT (NUDIX family)